MGCRGAVVPADPLLLACRRWLGRFVEQRERAIQNYASALQARPLNSQTKLRAIESYARTLYDVSMLKARGSE